MKPYYEGFDDTLAQVMKKVPRAYFVKSRWRASLSLLLSLACFVGSLLVIYALSNWDSFWKWPLGLGFSWWFMGTAMTGGFDLAHDAAHRSLFKSEGWNNFWGHFFGSLVGWPFHLWRHAHNLHHRYTNHAHRDIAWEPYTEETLAKIPRIYRWAFVLIKSNLFFNWIGGMHHLWEQVVKFAKGKRFAPADRGSIWFSFLVTALIFGSYFALTASWGIYGVVVGFLLPLCRYYFWLTTFTMLHHLHPERPFLDDETWSKNTGAAQLLGTINVRYGAYVDFLTHNIAWHIPHHVSVAIPHYHLKDATRALQAAYPGRLHEERFSWAYMRYILDHCQTVYSRSDLRWKKFARVRPRLSDGLGSGQSLRT